MHIADGITVDDGQKAVIAKYDFEVRDEAGHYQLTDPVIRKARRHKGGRYTGGNLDLLLTQAVTARNAHDAKADGATPPAAETPTEAPAPVADDAKPAKELKGATLDNTGRRERKPKREPAPKKENRYGRACAAILNDPTLATDDKALAKKTGMSESMAHYCIEAWNGMTKVLTERKLLKLPK